MSVSISPLIHAGGTYLNILFQPLNSPDVRNAYTINLRANKRTLGCSSFNKSVQPSISKSALTLLSSTLLNTVINAGLCSSLPLTIVGSSSTLANI